jgi:ATP-dependent Clp protease ATP-binding subunit ClpC
VGPELVLLTMVGEQESVAMRILGEAGASPDQIRTAVMDSLPANIPEVGLSGFERFTERARMAVELAETEARERKFSHVGTESLLLGLLREQEGLAARVLEALNVDLERARTGVLERVKPGEGHGPGSIPFTPRAEEVLERALDVDCGLRNHVGTEGILLALASVNEGEAITVLRGLGVDPDQIRDAVITERLGPGVRRLVPRSRARDYGQRMASASVSEAPVPESGFRVAVSPGGDVLRLLMSTAARALEGGRTEMTMRDLLLALVRDEDVGPVLAALGVEEAAILEVFDRRTAGEEPPEATAQS